MKTIDDLSKEEREEYLNDYSSATIEHFLMRKKMYEDFKKYSKPLTNTRNNIMIKNDVKEYFSINHNRPYGGEIKKIYDDFYGNIGNPLPPIYSISNDNHKEEKEVIITKIKLSAYLDENGNLKIDNEDN